MTRTSFIFLAVIFCELIITANAVAQNSIVGQSQRMHQNLIQNYTTNTIFKPKLDKLDYWENNDWANVSNTLNKYDKEGNILESILQDKNNNNVRQIIFSYNTNGLKIMESIQNWDYIDSIWTKSNRIIFKYDSKFRNIEELIQNYNVNSDSFENVTRQLYTYDEQDQLLLEQQDRYSNNRWKTTSGDKYIYTYNTYGQPLYYLGQFFSIDKNQYVSYLDISFIYSSPKQLDKLVLHAYDTIRYPNALEVIRVTTYFYGTDMKPLKNEYNNYFIYYKYKDTLLIKSVDYNIQWKVYNTNKARFDPHNKNYLASYCFSNSDFYALGFPRKYIFTYPNAPDEYNSKIQEVYTSNDSGATYVKESLYSRIFDIKEPSIMTVNRFEEYDTIRNSYFITYSFLNNLTRDNNGTITEIVNQQYNPSNNEYFNIKRNRFCDFDEFNTKTDTSSINELSLYPNPSNGNTNLHYTLNINSLVSIYVYDVQGRLVITLANNLSQSSGNYTSTINIEVAGIYYLVTNINGKVVTKKLIIL